MQPGDLFRASSLSFLCPREEVLAYQNDVIRVWHKDPGLQITLDIGNLFHDLYRHIYYGPMGEWIGAWQCIRCGWNTDEAGLSEPPRSNGGCVFRGKAVKMPSECGSCGAPFWIRPDDDFEPAGHFREWHIEDRVLGLKGHPDGWYLRPGFPRVLTDLKSHGHRGFGSRRKLRDGHDVQIWGYEYMTGDKGGEVWYLNKSPWGDHPSFLRQVVVPPDKKSFKNLVAKPLESLHNGLAGGPLPDRKCIGAGVPRAKDCQLCAICFDG